MAELDHTVLVLSPSEAVLDSLNPDYVQITETKELYKLRTIKIVHQLRDENSNDLTRYDSILISGNKIWREQTTDRDSCLYVIRGPKSYDFEDGSVTVTAIEVAVELGEIEILRDSGFEWTVSDDMEDIVTELFDLGVITGPTTSTAYSGALTPLAVINEIQTNTGGEFQYRYEYGPVTDKIKRYIDFYTTVGKTHPEVIEIGYNAKSMSLEYDESDVAVAAGPVGEPSSATDTFHSDRKAFEDLAVTKGASIPLYYTKDSSGTLVPGPNAYAPYAKLVNKGYVECDEESELIASYQHIHAKEGSATTYPRIYTFTSSETNTTNLYWDCVEKIREHLQPEVEIKCELVDFLKLEGAEGELFNIGDVVYIRLPGRTDVVECRITKTTKDPRRPDNEKIEISTYRTTFMAEFFKGYFNNPGAIVLD